MEYRQLGKTDLNVSAIGLGAVTFGREIDEATAFTVMNHALARGINLIDTAEAYAKGRSEEVVGAWLKQSGQRDKVVLATKLIPPLTAERIPLAVEASLCAIWAVATLRPGNCAKRSGAPMGWVYRG